MVATRDLPAREMVHVAVLACAVPTLFHLAVAAAWAKLIRAARHRGFNTANREALKHVEDAFARGLVLWFRGAENLFRSR